MTRCTRLGAGALVLATLTGLAGCHGNSSAAPSPSASGLTEAQIVAILQEYTQCMHDHGVPTFEQPTLVNGQVEWKKNVTGVDLDTMDAATEACRPIAQRLPDNLTAAHRVPTAAELEKLRQFAACMRRNGYPDWPDPDNGGRFAVIGTPMEPVLQKGADLPDACEQYLDGVRVGMTTP
jgi:hypothetical protein